MNNLDLNSEYALRLTSVPSEGIGAESKITYKYNWEEISHLQMHGYRVADISEKIAIRMGLGEKDIESARLCGYFHDIGKFLINPLILNKKDKLTDGEFAVIKEHVEYSRGIMIKMGYIKYSDIVLYHHEKMDGSGYYGLAGEEIPLISRIIALADVYDALTSDRSYRKAYQRNEALKIIELSKNKYDDKIYEAFTELYGNI